MYIYLPLPHTSLFNFPILFLQAPDQSLPINLTCAPSPSRDTIWFLIDYIDWGQGVDYLLAFPTIITLIP